MTTKQMDCCLELAETLNFSRAAENLFISQPSLTYQIKLLEDEIGFRLFDRSVKGAVMTPAGEQFCMNLRRIRNELSAIIEEGQNIGSKYSETLNVCIPQRSCMWLLPQILHSFETEQPRVFLNIRFLYSQSRIDGFLRGDYDILFSWRSEMRRWSGVVVAPLFVSRFYIIVRRDDPLASHGLLSAEDLAGRTLLVGGGSVAEMVPVQNRIRDSGYVATMNCPDHETALFNVSAGRGVVLSPGFSSDHNDQFVYVPFDCEETIECVLVRHKQDERESTRRFIELAQKAYREQREQAW